jgi:hypothetical protein
MTLDLSEYESATDSPEVAALKENVIRVARKYTNQHGWCNEVNKALAEMGIQSTPKPLVVHVTTTHPFEFDVRVDVNELVGKTETQQKSVVIAKMGSIYLNGNNAIRRAPTIVLKPADIADLSLPPKPEPSANWKYPTSSSRVKHWFDIDVANGERSGYSACGNAYLSRGHETITETSRGTGDNCARCTARNPG